MPDVDFAPSVTQTTTATAIRVPEAPETVVTARLLVSETAGLRDETNFLHQDSRELHRSALLHNLDVRTGPKAKLATGTLLGELASRGFAWNAVARLISVSVPALRKWRQGEPASAENRRKLAELNALCELLEDEYQVEDVAGWMEVPISSEAPVRPLDLYEADRAELLIDWAAHRMDPFAVLDEAFPGWHDRYQSEFEVFRADDGLALRLRDR